MSTEQRAASVMSTGGAGGEFERNLGAAFLGWLLVGACIPIRAQSVCAQVHFQTERLGWRTDDIAVEAVDDSGDRCWLLLQAKRQLRVSARDEDCIKAIQDAWVDFKSDRFNATRDAIAIVTHLGTNRLLGDFNSLLTQARTSRSADEFQQRLAGHGTLSERSKGDYLTIREIVEQSTGTIEASDIWRFLTVLHVLSFDLGSVSGKDEATLRTLLQFMRQPGDTGADVGSTWNELKSIAGAAAAVGQSFRREDLPQALQDRYRRVEASEHAAIRALRAHSEVVLSRIQEQGTGGLMLPRGEMLEQLQQATQNARVVVIVGGAGTGKSALAKRYIQSRPAGSAFAFAAEEFKVAHIDQVLAGAQVPLNWVHCHSLIPKVRTFLVEGLERLLEGDLRAAFVDLLRATADDEDSVLLVTCRDYHMEVVERSLLRPSGVTFTQVTVPELSDDEMNVAEQAVPSLTPLLAVPALRALLRNPFMLMRAASLQITDGAHLPETEQGLRTELWHQVVCNELVRRNNLPRRRAQALTQIALDRARSFQSFVKPPDDPEALQALALDGIVTEESLRHFAAPAHDVWEDWALLMWLQQQYAEAADDAQCFAQSIGTVPAMRRAYRKWLLELVETQPQAAPAYVATVLASSTQDVFKDDTLIGVFQSSRAADFLATFEAALLDKDAALLRRLLFLVRVACKTISPMAPGGKEALAMNWLVPTGRAWASTLEFVDTRWERIPDSLRSQILAFIEEWASGINFVAPYPAGAEHAGKLLQKLYPVVTTGYGEETERARVVALALDIPKSAISLVESLAQRALATVSRAHDDAADEFMGLLLKPYKAGALCRDFPELTSRLFFSVWFAPAPHLDDDSRYYSGLRGIPSVFGLAERHNVRMFPQSAAQGPFLQLLRSQPRAGIQFITELVNRACAFYGEQRDPLQFVDPPWLVEFVPDHGIRCTLWCNGRLWNAYRGTSVMPDVITCALMALEKWGLECAKHADGPEYLRPGLDWILVNSNNVALVAVVASICTAHPEEFGDVALKVLSSPEFFRYDIERQAAEHCALAVGGLGIHDEFLQKERIESNSLLHRKKHLEDLARDLQFSDYREQLHQVLDRFRAEVPDLTQQTEQDRLWRLALDRMDLRRWEVKEATSDGQLIVGMMTPDPDVQDMVDASVAAQQPAHHAMSLYLWGRKAFDRDMGAASAADEWRDRLSEVKRILDENEVESLEPWKESPGLIVAVCVRDHWDEMDSDSRVWCRGLVIDALLLHTADGVSAHDLVLARCEGIAACAHILPLMAARDASDNDLIILLMMAVMHPNKLVQESSLAGVSEVYALDKRLLPLVLNTLVAHAAATRNMERNRHQSVRINSSDDLLHPAQAVLETARDEWLETPPPLADIHADDWPGQRLVHSLLLLLEGLSDEVISREFFGRLVQLLNDWWSRDNRHSTGNSTVEIEHEAAKCLAAFLLHLEASDVRTMLAPLLDQIDQRPEKIATLLMFMLLDLDKRQDGDAAFWEAWAAITQCIAQARWVTYLTDRHANGEELVHQTFFNIRWTRNLRRWPRLQGHFADVDRLFTEMPASGLVLDAYVRYLHDIGEDSLPNAFVLIVDKMGDDLVTALQADSNLGWYLDALVARTLFEQLAAVRSSRVLRDAMMKILDTLVHAGSSAAFQLRDDFVTPHAAALS